MPDTFKGQAASLRDPVQDAVVISPSDSTDLPTTSRAIYVGTPGDLRVTLLSGAVVTMVGAQPGWHPIRVQRVWATGTTATDLLSCA